ncbi:MAG: hypothetical protein ABI266_04970 [Ginsengibacter sp.]
MPSKKEILKELEEISPLLCTIDRGHLFSVPFQYFEQLPAHILSTIQRQESEEEGQFKFSDIPGIVQDIPGDYFTTLSEKIFSKIKEEEIEDELSDFPLLVSLKGKNLFTVPEGYFENSAKEIAAKVTTNKTGIVVSINSGKVISMKSTWWKASAAAIIAGVVAVSSYFLVNNPSSDVQSTYLTAQNNYKTPNQVNEAIATLSDDEIAAYLEDNGSILDNDLLIKDVNTQELPAIEDYLLDDNTLNNYLNKIGASGVSKIN